MPCLLERRLAASLALLAATTLEVSEARADDVDELAGLLDEHVVTGASKSDELAKDAPATTSIITAEDIQRYGIRSLDEAINFLGMGLVTSDPLHSVEISGRGVGITADYGNHVLLVVDGHVFNEGWNGTAYFEQGAGIPLEMIDHIELVLGPGAVMYGGGSAMLGVINVVTKRGADWKGVHLTAAGSLSPQQGLNGNVTSWAPANMGGTYRLAAGFGHELTLLGIPASIAAQAEMYRQDGPSFEFAPQTSIDADGQPVNYGPRSPLGTWGGRALHSYDTSVPAIYARGRIGDLSVMFRAETYRRRTPTLGFNLYDSDFDEPQSFERDRFLSLDVQYQKRVTDRLRLSARGYADGYDYVERAYDSSKQGCSAPVAGACIQDYTGYSRWIGAELQAEYDWLGGDRLVTVLGTSGTIRNAGTEIDSKDDSTGNVVAVDGGRYDTQLVGAAYLQQRWRPTPWLRLNAGSRFDADPRGGERFSPRAAVSVDAWHGGELKAIYSEGFRAPSLYEAYYATPASARVDLHSETVRNAEVSVEQRIGRHRILFGVFRQWFEDMLILEEPPDGSSFYVNGESITSYGYNARIEGVVGALHYAASTTASYTRENEGDGKLPLPVAPQLSGNARVSYKLPDSLPTVALATAFVGKRYADRYESNFNPIPVTGPSAELRLTISQPIAAVPGLSYRVGATFVTGTKSPYVIGPTQSYAPDDPARGPAALAPVNRFSTFATLHYDFDL